MSGRMAGKVAIVTGGASGLGRGIVQAFAREGALVVIGDLHDAEQAANDVGSGAIGVHCDVSKSADCNALVAAAVEQFGGVDVLANCAGIAGTAKLTAELTDAEFDAVLGVNLCGCFFTMRAAIPEMIERGGGSIVNISSIASTIVFRTRGAYTAAKGGLDALTRLVAVEYAPKGIRANVLQPGLMNTPMFSNSYPVESELREREKVAAAAAPIGRMGLPSDIGNAAVFLASDESSFITGTITPVDGGYTSV